MADVADILTKLLDLTKESRVAWKPTVNEDTFSAVLGSKSVLVENDRNVYVLRILNKKGVELERLRSELTIVGVSSPSDERPIEDALSSLHHLAKRYALDVANELDQFMEELEKVGQPPQ